MELIRTYLTENPCYQANLSRADARYTAFQTAGPKGLMLHSVGCAQPSAQVFVNRWNKPTYTAACVHAFVDGATGAVWQTLPWNFRGWHCGKGSRGSANDTHVGVELCESRHIKYLSGAKFEVLDAAGAKADAKRTYEAAVELFARLCRTYAIDPMTGILSHREGGRQGVASGHVDPEHYWSGLGLPYTMDCFRRDTAAALAALEADPGEGGGSSGSGGGSGGKSGPIYRIQVGAFRSKTYAEAYLKTVQAHFPGAFLKAE